MNDFKINVGKLNKRIDIQRKQPVCDINGVTKNEYLTYKKVWASVNNLFGKEYWNAKEYGEEQTVEIVIRYNACKDIALTDRILFDNKIYNISFVDNICYRNEYFKIKATARE